MVTRLSLSSWMTIPNKFIVPFVFVTGGILFFFISLPHFLNVICGFVFFIGGILSFLWGRNAVFGYYENGVFNLFDGFQEYKFTKDQLISFVSMKYRRDPAIELTFFAKSTENGEQLKFKIFPPGIGYKNFNKIEKILTDLIDDQKKLETRKVLTP